ncbi:hypothetical protein JCM19239_6799 [Vibrio variabilis]|uniref:Uncharacterized protein n=1 Tax=Vibrio variabilis TaxID=990271 RepID=A0ABQ0JH56_9VIBR|nr:hypothetical protein JCM19239_6799 [Vibrio variabilis]
MTLTLSSQGFAAPSNHDAKNQTFTIGVLSNKARKHIVFSSHLQNMSVKGSLTMAIPAVA